MQPGQPMPSNPDAADTCGQELVALHRDIISQMVCQVDYVRRNVVLRQQYLVLAETAAGALWEPRCMLFESRKGLWRPLIGRGTLRPS